MATKAVTTQDVLPATAPRSARAGRNALTQLTGLLGQPAVRNSLPLIALLALLAAAALAWTMIATPPQKILYSGLSDGDKAAMSEALSQGNISNRVDPQTGTLTVGEDDYYRARMLLAAQNLPKAAPGGYAILDQLPMGVSRAVEGERLRQARETELAKSIEEIEGVTEARVHLAMPESTVFVRDNAAPSASVIVRLAAGRSLADSQTRSIINLVASSVPNMKPDAVTIVDGSGALLTKAGGNSGASAGDERIDFQRRVENKYRDQLTQLLTPLLGAGNFSAEVQADVDLDETQATRETYDKAGALRAEQGNWTGNGSESATPQGIPGTLSNSPPPATTVKSAEAAGKAPPAPSANTTTKQPDSAKQSDQFARSYELDKEISVRRQTPGSVKRLSVAVVIRDAEGVKPRSAAEVTQLTNLVRAAVGFDQTRNDQVTVISRKFAGATAEEGSPWYEAGWLPMVARNVTALIIAVLVIFLGIKPLVAAILKKRDAPDRGVDPVTGAPNREPVSIEMLDGARSYDDKVTLVRDFTRDNPARAALAVRDMIKSDAKAPA